MAYILCRSSGGRRDIEKDSCGFMVSRLVVVFAGSEAKLLVSICVVVVVLFFVSVYIDIYVLGSRISKILKFERRNRNCFV